MPKIKITVDGTTSTWHCTATSILRLEAIRSEVLHFLDEILAEDIASTTDVAAVAIKPDLP